MRKSAAIGLSTLIVLALLLSGGCGNKPVKIDEPFDSPSSAATTPSSPAPTFPADTTTPEPTESETATTPEETSATTPTDTTLGTTTTSATTTSATTASTTTTSATTTSATTTTATTTSATTTSATTTTTAAPVSYLSSTPVIITGKAPGTKESVKDKSTVDYSNTSDGYFTVKYTGKQARLVIMITPPKGEQYNYSFAASSDLEVIPLSEGNGTYKVTVAEANAAGQAVVLDTLNIDAKITNANAPFLMANAYVSFSSGSTAVNKAEELSKNKTTEVEKIEGIYNWFVDNMTYDTVKAANAASLQNYVPSPDTTVSTKKGVCFDYASAMAAMLRSQGIPCKVEVGYAGTVYHAWITTYTAHTGKVNGWITFDGKNWTLMEPTNANVSGNETKQAFRDFVNKTSNYKTLYHY